VEKLRGGNNDDVFRFNDNAKVTGKIDGLGGNDTLDYSLYTSAVSVNLATGVATGTGGVANIENVIGGLAADVLIGDAADNILWGNNGNDVLVGGAGNDVLVGGAGGALLDGGLARAVLIGGPPTD